MHIYIQPKKQKDGPHNVSIFIGVGETKVSPITPILPWSINWRSLYIPDIINKTVQ
jgi:hypothetical protein